MRDVDKKDNKNNKGFSRRDPDDAFIVVDTDLRLTCPYRLIKRCHRGYYCPLDRLGIVIRRDTPSFFLSTSIFFVSSENIKIYHIC